MRTVYEHAVGGDGAVVGAYIEGGDVVVKAKFPLVKAVEPLNKVIDDAINKLEALIPGEWDKALLEPIRSEAKAQLLKLLAE